MADIKKIRTNWEEHYKETPMEKLHWYSETIDPEVLLAIREFCPGCTSVLDIGTGPGTTAIKLAKLGYNVTATDIAESAINMAKNRAGAISEKINFVVDDVRNTILKEKFDIIHDRGCFHVLDKDGIKRYLDNIPKLLKENGILLLKTFSTKETELEGPNKYNYDMIKSIFSGLFKFLHFEETTYPSTLPRDPKAFFCVLTHE